MYICLADFSLWQNVNVQLSHPLFTGSSNTRWFLGQWAASSASSVQHYQSHQRGKFCYLIDLHCLVEQCDFGGSAVLLSTSMQDLSVCVRV